MNFTFERMQLMWNSRLNKLQHEFHVFFCEFRENNMNFTFWIPIEGEFHENKHKFHVLFCEFHETNMNFTFRLQNECEFHETNMNIRFGLQNEREFHEIFHERHEVASRTMVWRKKENVKFREKDIINHLWPSPNVKFREFRVLPSKEFYLCLTWPLGALSGPWMCFYCWILAVVSIYIFRSWFISSLIFQGLKMEQRIASPRLTRSVGVLQRHPQSWHLPFQRRAKV